MACELPPEIRECTVRNRRTSDLCAIGVSEVMRVQNDVYALRAGVVNDVINITKFGCAQGAVHNRLNTLQKERKSDRRKTLRSEVVYFGVGRVGVVVINSPRSTGPILGSRNIDSKNTKSSHSVVPRPIALNDHDFAELASNK